MTLGTPALWGLCRILKKCVLRHTEGVMGALEWPRVSGRRAFIAFFSNPNTTYAHLRAHIDHMVGLVSR